MNLNKLAKQAHATASKRGFFPAESIDRNIIEVIKELGELSDAVKQNGRVNPKAVEIFEKDQTICSKTFYENSIKDTIEQEAAGALVAILSICHDLGIDIDRHVKAEMKFNEMRVK